MPCYFLYLYGQIVQEITEDPRLAPFTVRFGFEPPRVLMTGFEFFLVPTSCTYPL